MKCDELQYERLGDANKTYPASTLVIRKQFVDAAIAELKTKLAEEREFGLNRAKSADHEIGKLCVEVKNLNKQLRATKRALWLARGYIMTLLNRDFQRLAYQCNNGDYKKNLLRRRNRYYELSEKCLKKAKEYK